MTKTTGIILTLDEIKQVLVNDGYFAMANGVDFLFNDEMNCYELDFDADYPDKWNRLYSSIEREYGIYPTNISIDDLNAESVHFYKEDE